MISSGNSRIVKRELVDGDVSITFSVVRHRRINGRSRHVELAKIGTFHQSEFAARAEEFWDIVDEKLGKLVMSGKLMNADRTKIERKFSKLISRPVATAIRPETNREILNALIREIAEKAQKKLALERGKII